MKNIISYILICICLLGTETFAQQQRSYKRGLSYNIPYVEDLPVLGKGVSWYYNWGHTPAPAVINHFKEYIDFIPMAWSGVNEAVMREYLTNHPEVKYILGFNEPNFRQQANLTPTQAAARWPDIEKIADEFNLKIVGPALNFGPSNGSVTENGVTYTDPVRYMDDFLAACPDCRIDYIAIHSYMNMASSVEWFIGLFKKYNKPIWLTEFCAWEYNQGLTPERQKDFMVDVLTYMENDPDVYRYAWFIGRNNSGENAFPYMALMTNNDKGVLKELGDIYVNMSPFDHSYHYDTETRIEAEHFINAHSASLRRIDETSGNLYLNDFFFKDWTAYQVELPEEKEYTITLRMACIDGTYLQILDNQENVLRSQEIASTGGLNNWDYRTISVTLPAGKQTIRLKSMGEGCNIDWLTFAKINTSVEKLKDISGFKLYPNPIQDVLNIETSSALKEIRIFDSLGKIVFQGNVEKTVDTSNLNKGMYVVQLTFDDDITKTASIIK